jgi:autotransporter-associated beta strand protein
VVSAINMAGESANSAQASATPIQVAAVVWTNIAPGNWSAGTRWQGGVAPLAGGSTTYNLKWNTTPYAGVSSNDLAGPFVVNRLEFGSALPALTNNGNPLQFAANGATQPQVLQNSTKAVVLANNLALAPSTTIGGTGAGALTFAGVVSGTGNLLKTNSGMLTVGGAGVNTYSGGTVVSAGTLVLNLNRFSLGYGPVTMSDGTTFYTGNFEGNTAAGAITNTFNLSGGFATTYAGFGNSKDIWITGPVTGAGGLQAQGSGRTPGVMLSGAKTFSGGVKLSAANGGTPMVTIDNLGSLGTGTLRSELTATDVSAANLRASANLTAAPGVANPIDLAPGCRLVVSADGANNLWLSGPITNAGSLYKIGTAALTLSGMNTYSGPTIVVAGRLACASPAALGSGALSIANGAVLQLDYFGTRAVASLILGGTSKPSGSYGSSSSTATTKDDTHFAGTGTVTVGPLPPATGSLTNLPATGIAANSANLNATLGCAGDTYNVVAYWNMVNGGTNAALWTNSAPLGAWANVASTNLSYTVAGLTPSRTYYFAFRATNMNYSVWATNVLSFTSLAPPLPPPTPELPVSGVKVTGGVPSFSFTAAAGCKYRLDYKNALTDADWTPGAWSTNSTGGALPMMLTDPTAAGQPQRFYRLEAANP